MSEWDLIKWVDHDLLAAIMVATLVVCGVVMFCTYIVVCEIKEALTKKNKEEK